MNENSCPPLPLRTGMAQYGLRDMKPVSCPPARFLGDINKIAEMTQLQVDLSAHKPFLWL